MEDLICGFSEGAAEGWDEIWRLRNFGQNSLKFLIQEMSSWQVQISVELCYPTEQSGVQALDLDRDTLRTLRSYHIETIGELAAACEDKNRFSGLRHVDAALYEEAIRYLERCGFVIWNA